MSRRAYVYDLTYPCNLQFGSSTCGSSGGKFQCGMVMHKVGIDHYDDWAYVKNYFLEIFCNGFLSWFYHENAWKIYCKNGMPIAFVNSRKLIFRKSIDIFVEKMHKGFSHFLYRKLNELGRESFIIKISANYFVSKLWEAGKPKGRYEMCKQSL